MDHHSVVHGIFRVDERRDVYPQFRDLSDALLIDAQALLIDAQKIIS
jgi:hypothetical protein